MSFRLIFVRRKDAKDAGKNLRFLRFYGEKEYFVNCLELL